MRLAYPSPHWKPLKILASPNLPLYRHFPFHRESKGKTSWLLRKPERERRLPICFPSSTKWCATSAQGAPKRVPMHWFWHRHVSWLSKFPNAQALLRKPPSSVLLPLSAARNTPLRSKSSKRDAMCLLPLPDAYLTWHNKGFFPWKTSTTWCLTKLTA